MLSAISRGAAKPAQPLRMLARNFSSGRKEVVIVSATRTPIGSFRSTLSSLSAIQLGAVAIKKAVLDAGCPLDAIEEAYIGNVIQAGLGQAPGRQAVIGAGLPSSVRTTTVNKVCASSMKAMMFATQAIQLGDRDIVLAAGMESMSNAPYFLPKGRTGYGYGHGQVVDGVINDGLWDPYTNLHMGNCAEKTSRDTGFGRESQDDYAERSYKLAQAAQKNGDFDDEIVPVTIKGLKGKPDVIVNIDEEPGKVKFDKIRKLRSAFETNGAITAANCSKINDGGVAMVLMSREKCDQLGLKPLARIISYGDAEIDPIDFPIAPTFAVEEAIKKANLKIEDIHMWEVNEAFSVVPLAHQKHFGYSMDKLNIHGGAVALGHPLGMSGARIITHLVHSLKKTPGAL
eukprot:Ihof_evm1s843 gene=Ihof_evmTU1s843